MLQRRGSASFFALCFALGLANANSAGLRASNEYTPKHAYRAGAAADALSSLAGDSSQAANSLQNRRDRFAEACKMNEIGTQSRAQCDQILKCMDSKIENIKATGGAYGEIVGHLKVIAGRA